MSARESMPHKTTHVRITADPARFEPLLGGGFLLSGAAGGRLEEFRRQFPGRTEMIEYAKARGIPVSVSASKPYCLRPWWIPQGVVTLGVEPCCLVWSRAGLWRGVLNWATRWAR